MIPEHELRQMYYNEGMTQKEIAETFDVGQPTISNWMQLYNIKSRTISKSETIDSIKPSKENLEKMYYTESMTLIKIAAIFNICPPVVKKWMNSYGMQTRTLSEAMLVNSTNPSKKVLEEMYCDKKMTMDEIAYEFDVCKTTIFKWMRSYKIEPRTNSDFAGINSPCWKGGISFEPYCERFNNEFKEAVRERDNYMCQLCGHEQNGRKLDVHHIHYDKENCYPDVVALCRSCNSKVNSNRNYWEQYFESKLLERGLLIWSINQEP